MDEETMRFHNIIVIGSIVLLLCTLAVSVHAQIDEQTGKVNATITLTFETGTNLTATTEMDVLEITTDRTYTKQDIQNIQDPQELGALRYAVYIMLKDVISETFPDASLYNFAMPMYQNSQFTETLNIQLPAAFFHLNSTINADEFINGVLDMDAVVSYAFNFYSSPGWNTSYIVSIPPTLTFRNTTGDATGNEIRWDLYNWNGQHPNKQGALTIQAVHPTSLSSTQEEILLEFNLDSTLVHKTSLRATLNAQRIDISSYAVLPSSVTNLAVIPADGIRLFIKNGFFSWQELYERNLQDIEQRIVLALQTSRFNETLDFVFAWDQASTYNCSTPYDITSMDSTPPITVTWTDTDIGFRILNISAKAVFGLINAGAQADVASRDMNFGENLESIGYPYSCTLTFPTHVFLNGKNPYRWNQTIPFSGILNSDSSPTYAQENKKTTTIIELTKMDLNVPSFITGRTELTSPIYSTEDTDIFVTRIPSEFSLPQHLYIDYLNSDSFRLCIGERVFSDEQLNDFLFNQKYNFETRLSSIVKSQTVSGFNDWTVFNASLQWDEDILKMDGNTPVTVSSYAHYLYTVPFNLSVWPPSFRICDQQFEVKGLEDRSIMYRILFPAGVSITAYDSLGKTLVLGENDKGQQYVEVTFSAQEALDGDSITCQLTASSLFVLGLFLPCILSVILVVVLVIIIFIINKKRKNRGIPHERRIRKPLKKVKEVEKEEDAEPEDQEFYVPPPPPSARR